MQDGTITRRGFLAGAAAAVAATASGPVLAAGETPAPGTTAPPGAATGGGATGALLRRPIGRSGSGTRPAESLPVIGLGTSDTFDVDPSAAPGGAAGAVYDAFAAGGGTVLDTSPMYGRAEAVLGALLAARRNRDRMFVATKVWTRGREAGEKQIADSMAKMGVKTLDLLQIHNLLDWREHVPTLRALREKGAIRYTGITHYTVASHADLEAVLRAEPFDFVQLNYSLATRDAEQRLLPFCRERGIAVLVNRAFEDGRLFAQVKGRELPPWAAEFDCTSWAQFFLKYVISHPAVTCVIPATSNVKHQLDNLRGGVGRLPDAKQRERMVQILAA